MDSYAVGAGIPNTAGIIQVDRQRAEESAKRAYAEAEMMRKTAGVERSPTLTDVVALSDQLQAAVQDVADAWIQFQQGYDPASEARSGLDRTTSPQSYRIDRLHGELHEHIAALKRIANDIRSRA